MKPYAVYLVAGLAVCLAFSCARSFNPDIKRGSTYKYKKGHPDVRFSAVGLLNSENESYINITADIVYSSVFYKREGNKRKANLAIELRILDKTNDNKVIKSERFSYDQLVEPSVTRSQKVFNYNRDVPVKPGKYEVRFTIIDQHTSRKTTRIANSTVPNPREESTSITNIRMLGKQMGRRGDSWFQVPTYDIPAKLDSVKFVMRVNNKSDSVFTINSELIKFEADTSYASPMYAADYTPSDIAYKGIDYSSNEVIESSTRRLLNPGSVTIEYIYPVFERGNYRFNVKATEEGTEFFKGRDFGIKSENYPALISARELARPLVYIMDSGEYEDLMTLSNSDSIKQAVDRFWLRLLGNQSEARTILRLYYERVEEANKRFANFKEGWKTDRGMIFILFGTPYFSGEIRQQLTWSYSHNRSDNGYNYQFEKARTKTEFYPFDYYRLQRNGGYYQREYHQRQLWRTGIILVRRL